MGCFNNLSQLEIEENRIEHEARIGLSANEYSLIVDGKKQDQIRGMLGKFYLHSSLNVNGEEKPFRVKIIQHFGTFFTVEFNGQQYTPRKIY
ncbi:MAG: hypothetical protein ACSHX8_13560 [Opitutaceae bacterium]